MYSPDEMTSIGNYIFTAVTLTDDGFIPNYPKNNTTTRIHVCQTDLILSLSHSLIARVPLLNNVLRSIFFIVTIILIVT